MTIDEWINRNNDGTGGAQAHNHNGTNPYTLIDVSNVGNSALAWFNRHNDGTGGAQAHTINGTIKPGLDLTSDTGDSWFTDFVASLFDDKTDTSGDNPIFYGGSSNSGSAQSINYQNADLARAYGMDAATAYQEALANTAHQREVADLKAAGLNPVLSARAGSGAGGVSGASVMSTGGSSGYSASKSDGDGFDIDSALNTIGKVANTALKVMQVVSMFAA